MKIEKTTVAPGAEPITLSELKSKIGLKDGDVLDADLTMLITSARQWVEKHTGRRLITQTVEKALDAFEPSIELAPNVQSVTSVKYLDQNGVLQDLAATEYTLDDYAEPARIVPAYGKTWPSARAVANAVKVVFVAGYGVDGTAVPAAIRHAIVLIVGQSVRGQSGNEVSLYPLTIPNAARDLLFPFMIMKIA